MDPEVWECPVRARESHSAVSVSFQDVGTHRAVSYPVCLSSLCSHSHPLSLSLVLLPASAFSCSNTEVSSWKASWPLCGVPTHVSLLTTSCLLPSLLLYREKTSTLGGRVLVEEITSHTLRVTKVSLSPYVRIQSFETGNNGGLQHIWFCLIAALP